MEGLFILRSDSRELLSFVAGKLVTEEIEFSFEEVSKYMFALTCRDCYSLDYFADMFVCDVDSSADYEVEAL